MKSSILLLIVALLGATATLFAQETPITIGVTFVTLSYPYFVPMKVAAEKTAAELDVKLVFVDPYGDKTAQSSELDGFIKQKVNGILVDPITVDSAVPAIEEAVAAGIPVVTVDREANTNKVLAHVGPDEVEGGREAARYVINKLGNKGAVLELEGTPGASPTLNRKKGFDEVIGMSNVKILASQDAEFDRDMAKIAMISLMAKFPKFDAVFAHNDDMIIGAIQALTSAGITPSTKVSVGYDASSDGLAYVKEGKVGATVATQQDQQASQALAILVEYIRNKKKPEKTEILITPKLVTAAQ